MRRLRAQLLGWMTPMLAAAPAMAQSGLIPQVQLNSIQRIAPGGSDVDPLRGNPRVLPTDLRSPLGFDQLFLQQGTDRFGHEQTMFTRRSGGLTAVFPRSVYVPSRRGGLVPDIPAGTVFIIDDGRSNGPPPPTPSRSYNAASYAAPVNSAAQPAQSTPPSRSAAPRPVPVSESIWKDEEYRQRLIERLLESATR